MFFLFIPLLGCTSNSTIHKALYPYEYGDDWVIECDDGKRGGYIVSGLCRGKGIRSLFFPINFNNLFKIFFKEISSGPTHSIIVEFIF